MKYYIMIINVKSQTKNKEKIINVPIVFDVIVWLPLSWSDSANVGTVLMWFLVSFDVLITFPISFSIVSFICIISEVATVASYSFLFWAFFFPFLAFLLLFLWLSLDSVWNKKILLIRYAPRYHVWDFDVHVPKYVEKCNNFWWTYLDFDPLFQCLGWILLMNTSRIHPNSIKWDQNLIASKFVTFIYIGGTCLWCLLVCIIVKCKYTSTTY